MGIEQLVNRAEDDPRAAQPQGYQGRFVEAPAPGALATVSVDALDGLAFQEVPFVPRGATLPSAGDRCLVALDDQGDAWVTCWWPS